MRRSSHRLRRRQPDHNLQLVGGGVWQQHRYAGAVACPDGPRGARIDAVDAFFDV